MLELVILRRRHQPRNAAFHPSQGRRLPHIAMEVQGQPVPRQRRISGAATAATAACEHRCPMQAAAQPSAPQTACRRSAGEQHRWLACGLDRGHVRRMQKQHHMMAPAGALRRLQMPRKGHVDFSDFCWQLFFAYSVSIQPHDQSAAAPAAIPQQQGAAGYYQGALMHVRTM